MIMTSSSKSRNCIILLAGMITIFTLRMLLPFWTPLATLTEVKKDSIFTKEDNRKHKQSVHGRPTEDKRREVDCEIPPLADVEDFFKFIRRENRWCNKMMKFGGEPNHGDGSKMVCLDYPMKPGNCTVLSFGINNEWSFDDEMDNLGCQVYAFDPSMGRDDFNRSARIHFYNLGISDFQGDFWPRTETKWKMDRYENIIKKLGLTDVDIDYLKMDVEGSEIQFMEDVVTSSPELIKKVKQIGMEIHPGTPPHTVNEENLKPTRFGQLWQGMHKLECLGFRMVNIVVNPVTVNHYTWKGRTESGCYELLWMRVDK